MNKTSATMTPTQILTYVQQLTNVSSFNLIGPQEPPQEPHLHTNKFSAPFAIYQHHLAETTYQPVPWLWHGRLPLSGITLLDGDHGLGKTVLTLHIAAAVSNGTSMLDATPTLRGGVVIVAPNTDAKTTQLRLLTMLGADLSRIEILSFVSKPTASSQTSGARPFSLPEDFDHLLQAIDRVDARLVILDPFIPLLSSANRWTDMRLGHLLADLNQRLIERNVACLLVRNCPAKGGHARPSVLERSDHFLTTAVSRLLLAPHPFQPDQLLLSHALSRHSALAPTLILQIQRRNSSLHIPCIVHLGSHHLSALDFIENRPDTLHRRLLFEQLRASISASPDPMPVATLYTRSPNSSVSQIQRTLNDLLRMGQIERPARGFYAKAPADPVFTPNAPAKTPPIPKIETDAEIEERARKAVAAIKARNAALANEEITLPSGPEMTPYAKHFMRLFKADQAAEAHPSESPTELKPTGATTSITEQADMSLDTTGATTSPPRSVGEANQ